MNMAEEVRGRFSQGWWIDEAGVGKGREERRKVLVGSKMALWV
jgi:hypothetical protein